MRWPYRWLVIEDGPAVDIRGYWSLRKARSVARDRRITLIVHGIEPRVRVERA